MCYRPLLVIITLFSIKIITLHFSENIERPSFRFYFNRVLLIYLIDQGIEVSSDPGRTSQNLGTEMF